jgi:hypothetical protein
VECIEQTLDALHLFLGLQEDGHDHRLKRPWARHHDAGLDVELGAIEEPIEDDLILLWECPLEWRPSAALIVNELAQRWECLAHSIQPPAG